MIHIRTDHLEPELSDGIAQLLGTLWLAAICAFKSLMFCPGLRAGNRAFFDQLPERLLSEHPAVDQPGLSM